MLRALIVAFILHVGGSGQINERDAGTVILLSVRPSAEASPILASALTDPNPAVRTAAARVAAVNFDARLAGDLLNALTVEQDDMAAGEQVRALLLLQGDTALATVDPHVARLGGRTSVALADWLAHHQPGELARRLPQLAASVPPGLGSLVGAVAHAARDGGMRLELLNAWMPLARRASWKAVLDRVLIDDDDLAASTEIVLRGLRAPQPHVREETIWFLVYALGRKMNVPESIVKAALPEGSPGPTIDWEILGRELIARRVTKASLPDRSEFLRSQQFPLRLAEATILPLLSDGEATLVRAAFPKWEPAVSVLAHTGEVPVRTVSEWIPGVVAMTAAAAGCRIPSSVRFGYARVTYDERGRAARTEINTSELRKECHPVLAALARTGLADADRPVKKGQQQWQVLPLSQAFVSCTSTPSSTHVSDDELAGDQIEVPRKLKDVRPQYPEDLQQKRVQGTVVADAVIAESGCVRALRVVKSAGALGLDLAAVRAVSGWVFSPTMLNGERVAVQMTVTVNFKLI